jgi:hypothetical protein
VKRPGNTRVITTVRPVVAEQVFRALLAPYEATGQITRFSNMQLQSTTLQGDRLTSVVFAVVDNPESTLTVNANMTIDASDWGDVIKAAGAEYDFGIDASGEFGEPSAPSSHQPETDMNPITWCAILEEQDSEVDFSEPAGFEAANFQGRWGWIKEDFAYTTRRLVDGNGNDQITHPDLVLINNPNVDYPLDQHTAAVANALEAIEPGLSARNIVQLTPGQRQIVFDDAKRRTLHYLYYLRSNFPKFKRLALSDEFGTDDKLPPKPYLRESLRLVARHIITEQEILGFGDRSHYAHAMYPDAVFSWQFELDFHPTTRKWLSDEGDKGPWEADFRGNRRFGGGGTGRAVFPLRSLVPVRITGLLAAQKNLGYTSIVGSSCRLHDQSVAAGQAAGAVAAVSLRGDTEAGQICFNQQALAQVWDGLLGKHGVGVAIWPFADLDPDDPGFAAIQQLALRRLLPIAVNETSFQPDVAATEKWLAAVVGKVQDAGFDCVPPELPQTRRQAAVAIWKQVADQPLPKRQWLVPGDADDDGLPDASDPLPFTKGRVTWTMPEQWDGVPRELDADTSSIEAFNFTSRSGPAVAGFINDHGAKYSDEAGFGWLRDQTNNTRLRDLARGTVRDGFVFTRAEEKWQRKLENGSYAVTVCIGDVGFDQPGQYVAVEGNVLASNLSTQKGSFRELTSIVEVSDGQLTVTIGRPEGGSNTALNWIFITPYQE